MMPVAKSLHLSCASPVLVTRTASRPRGPLCAALPSRRAPVTTPADLAAGLAPSRVAIETRRTVAAGSAARASDAAPVPVTTPVALVTGATSDGIGARVMEGLLQRGFDIVAVARSPQRAARLQAMAAAYPKRKVEIHYGDLALERDVRRVAQNIAAAHPRIDRIVNSLGVMLPDAEQTSEGRDRSEMVNALAPWMLARLLMPCLALSDDPRIIQLNSDGHEVFAEDAPNIDRMPKMFRLYGADKITALQLNYALARRLRAENSPVKVNSVHPGIVRTELGRHMDKAGPWWQRPLWIVGRWLHTRTADTPQKAAAPIIALATDPAYRDENGAYYAGSVKTDSSPASRDEAAADVAWDKYSDLLNLPRETLI